MTKQQEYSTALRAMADWFDEHPNVPIPENEIRVSAHFQPENIGLIPEGRVTMKEPTTATDTGLYQVWIDGEGFSISFFCGLRRVCEKKVISQRAEVVDVVEWVVKRPVVPQVAPETPSTASEAKIEG